jgi:glycyl-tRNA synthetase beta chain
MAKAARAEDLLVELLTEELPPRSLLALAQAFADEVLDGLVQHGLTARDLPGRRVFATPRRLATLIPAVLGRGEDRESEVSGPPVKAPAEAVAGFARKNGVAPEALEQRDTPKGRVYVARKKISGAVLGEILAEVVGEALRKLPVAKLMRWGAGEAQFVRPVHGLVMLHGKSVVGGSVLGVSAGRTTSGHRFLSKGSLSLEDAASYERTLLDDGHVVADFALRRRKIADLLQAAARQEQADLGAYEDLLDEVTALVEFPAVYAGGFDASFLEVPQECLVLTMRQNQKYFPLLDASGRLLAKFLIVSNMDVRDSRNIVLGNERVVRPRLQDARFFFDQDRKVRLESRVPQLARVVYHRKLGSQIERVQRIQLLAGSIARQLAADGAVAERAAWLCKADLLTGMVGEFPELQGIMGRYYALHDGEPAAVADAIEQHYRPRFAGDALPATAAACAIALADKLDTLVGLFGAGEQPTGEKDPFALRRQALGVLRILLEKKLPLPLGRLLDEAAAGYRDLKALLTHVQDVRPFLMERLRNLLREQGFQAHEVDAVVSQSPDRIDLVPARLEAVRAFAALPEAESLAAANKRIANILRQAEAPRASFDPGLLALDEEKALLAAFSALRNDFEKAYEGLRYTDALKSLAGLKGPVDAFFDKVMVMDKDAKVRANRIGFLAALHETMNRIADLSRLAK